MKTTDERQENLAFTKKVYADKQFQYANREELLPESFISYHKMNFVKFFSISEEEFRGKKILDTGVGPGKHAAVLALMGGDVLGVDLAEKNIEKANELKKRLSLDNLRYVSHDLMEQIHGYGQFDLISAHNWMQHAENPAKVMSNLVRVLKKGGRFYLSLYLAKSFRFLIAQIARSILNPEDYDPCELLVGYHFPTGFNGFGNYRDIYMENIFDDFFVPYCNTTTYEIVIRDAEKMGCRLVTTEIPADKDRYEVDNLALRIGFEKVEDRDFSKADFEFTKPVDELASNNPYVREIADLAHACISKFRYDVGQYAKCAFILGLYRVRAEMNQFEDIDARFATLRFYLEQAIDDTNWKISAANPMFVATAKK